MNFLLYFTVFLFVLVCVFLIGVVLLQQGKSADLASAFGGQGTQTAFGPRGTANLFTAPHDLVRSSLYGAGYHLDDHVLACR